MADNVEITAGAGTKIATDEVEEGGVKVQVQRVKVQAGADGSATDVSEANPLPIGDAGGSLTVDSTALGTTADAEAEGNGSIIAILKRLRKLLEGTGTIIVSKVTEAVTVKKVEEAVTIKKVEEALPAGAALLGKVKLEPATATGLTISRVIAAASTNATSAKASAGQVY